MIDRRRFLKFASACALSGIALGVRDAISAPRCKLLFVHGRGQQGLDPVALKATWLAALNKGGAKFGKVVPDDMDIAFPFYGDTLDRFTREMQIPLTSDMGARGPLEDEFLVFQAQFAEALRQQAGITDAQVDAEYGNDPAPRGPLNWRWVQAILRSIDKSGTGMNQSTLEAFTRDVFLYTTRAGVRDEIDRIVAAKLTEEPTVVVSHSLGTVVAYSVLCTDRRRLQVPLFVTVGSPLGVRAVRDQFRPLRSPPNVASWYNAFDTRDVVALYPLDKDNFPVNPAIRNNNSVRNHTDNRHGIVGYLDDAAVAQEVFGKLL